MESQLRRIVRERSLSLERDAPVGDAIAAVRNFTPVEGGAEVYYVYVTDEGRLVGVVSLRELLNAEDDAPLSDVMNSDPVRVTVTDRPGIVARRIVNSGFPVLPVVEGDEQFLGIVRANDVIDALDEETTKALFKQAGLWMR